MIERYSYPEMSYIWSDQAKLENWLAIEIAACEAWNKLGEIPDKALAQIKAKAGFDIARVNEIERTTDHDVIAFLTNVAENVGPDSRFIHVGLTSSDILDTCLAMQMRDASRLIAGELRKMSTRVLERAVEFKHTPMMGRTHGVHAEPITFGLKLLLWHAELERHRDRLRAAAKRIAVGKISGAVGTYANVPLEIEEIVMKRLGLTPAPISTQIVQRDRHAEFMNVLALIGATIEKMAVEVRGLQRTEVLEAEEPFKKGQKGSSAMPHKRNPITCERMTGMARVLRGNALAAMENVALWHERDISHSSVERIILPDSTILLHYMLRRMFGVVDRMNVYPKRMLENINRTRGLIFSQRVLLALAGAGMTREDAYALVQKEAMKTWETGADFKKNIMKNKEVKSLVPAGKLEELFDFSHHLKNVDAIFARFGV